MELRIEKLATASLSASTLRRGLPPDFHADASEIEAQYDTTTLWYDAIWRRGRVAVVCPMLFGIEDHVTDGQLELDGHPVRPTRIERRFRHQLLWLPARKRPQNLAVTIGGERLCTPIHDASDPAFFRGLNTHVALQKDNDPIWIRESLTYNREVHGLQAALIFDNGSTRYGLDAIADAGRAAGLERMMIIRVPLRFGMTGQTAAGAPNFLSKPMQVSLLNIARLRFLRDARAVLQCDIDELVWCKRGSIFDAVRRHPFGYAWLSGEWRYADPAAGQLPRHRDHVLRRTGNNACSPKFCIRPSGPLGWLSWRLHGLASIRGQRLLRPKWAGFWHCRQITTNWKPSAQKLVLPEDLTKDTDGSDILGTLPFWAA